MAIGLAGCVEGRAADPEVLGEWKTVEAQHFTVFSNAGNRKTDNVVDQLNGFREGISRFLPALEQAPLRPVYVYVFKSKKSFAPYGLDRKNVAGYFVGHPVANYMVVDSSSIDTFAGIYHEYVHFLVHNNLPFTPTWLNEGLAHYFETFTLQKGKASIGLAHQGLLSHLTRPRRQMSLLDVLRVGTASDAYIDPQDAVEFRAQAWLLVHYLLEGTADRRQKTARVFELLSQGQSSEQALTSALDMNLERLQRELAKYVRLGKLLYQSLSISTPHAAGPSLAQPMKEIDVFCRLGDLLLTGGPEKLAAARNHFQAALGIDPTFGPALVGAATARLGQEDFAGAQELAEKAVELHPSTARAQFALGNVLLGRLKAAEANPSAEGSGLGWLPRARDAFQKAFKADPRLVAAYNNFAHTYVIDTESPQPGIDLAKKVLERVPDLTLALTLVELYSRAGDREAAREIYDRHIEPTRGSLGEIDGSNRWAVVEQAILRADLMAADAWSAAGRTDEALRLLKEIREKTSEEALQEDVARRIVDLEVGDKPTAK